MTALAHVLRFLLAAAPWAMARGALLSIAVLLMGAALLGLVGLGDRTIHEASTCVAVDRRCRGGRDQQGGHDQRQ